MRVFCMEETLVMGSYLGSICHPVSSTAEIPGMQQTQVMHMQTALASKLKTRFVNGIELCSCNEAFKVPIACRATVSKGKL